MTTNELNELLLQQVASLTATVEAQAKSIEELNQTIKELKEQLNKNSKNSSKPNTFLFSSMNRYTTNRFPSRRMPLLFLGKQSLYLFR